jgi:mono/diheme cytochrome c family protein
MRLVVAAALTAALLTGGIVAGCGYEGKTTASPETVEGTAPATTDTTETTETTETATTETETTETTGTTETTETAPLPEGNAAAGKDVFTTNCAACHTLADAGTSGTIGPNLDQAKPPASLVIERVTNGKGQMPPFKGTLSDQQIADVAAYVSTAAG